MNKELNKFPKRWRLSLLSEIVEVNGITVNPKKEFYNNEFSYIDIDSIENETGRIKHTKKYKGYDAPSRARRVVKYNDVIMSTVRPYLKAFAVIPKEHENHICSTGFAVLSPHEKIDSKYLLYVLFSRYVINQCKKMMIGAQYPALNESQVKQIKIPLPPLPEQKKIAEILSTVDQAIEKTVESIKKTDKLKNALMQKLLSRGIGHKKFKKTVIGEIPIDWESVRVNDVCEKPEYGYTESATEKPIGPRFLRISDIHDGIVQWESVPYCQCPESLKEKYVLRSGDILFARTGATTGKSYIIKKCPEAVFASYLIRIVTKEKIDSNFLYLVFNSYIYWKQIAEKISGSAQGGINASSLSNIKIPLPSLHEQKKIAGILGEIDKKLELLHERKRKFERIKKGLMNNLLTGKRRVKL